jgi:hypothetical protein
MVPIGSFSGKLIAHRKRAQHLEAIELADESEGAGRYNKCTWVITAEVQPAGPRQDRERISLNFEMASINLRQSAFSATLGQCDPSVSAPGGSTATLLLISLCSLRHRSINEKMTYPFVGGGRNSLLWRLHTFSASAIG